MTQSTNRPTVALESTLISHGFAPPANVEIAQQMEAAVRNEGAIPATIAVLEGKPRVGISNEELAALAADRKARKISLRDLAVAMAQGANGGTTVAATMHLARRAGIGVPVPKADELEAEEAKAAIAQAVEDAESAGIFGKELTPFLLARTVELTDGRSRRANKALLLNNARVAARIARAMADAR